MVEREFDATKNAQPFEQMLVKKTLVMEEKDMFSSQNCLTTTGGGGHQKDKHTQMRKQAEYLLGGPEDWGSSQIRPNLEQPWPLGGE